MLELARPRPWNALPRILVIALWTALSLGVGLGPGASETRALSVDFESLAHGEVANGSLGASGLGIDAINASRSFDLAVGFDTSRSGTADRDLEFGGSWSAGNLAGVPLGLILILQENDLGCGTGICSSPDDEGRRPAGDLILSFATPLIDFGLDLVDVESATSESGALTFFDGVRSASVGFSEFLDPASPFYDASIVFADNSANRIGRITAAALGLERIDTVTVSLGGSGGIDNLQGSLEGSIVPEPTTALMMMLGLAGLSAARRTSRASGD